MKKVVFIIMFAFASVLAFAQPRPSHSFWQVSWTPAGPFVDGTTVTFTATFFKGPSPINTAATAGIKLQGLSDGGGCPDGPTYYGATPLILPPVALPADASTGQVVTIGSTVVFNYCEINRTMKVLKTGGGGNTPIYLEGNGSFTITP